MSANPAAKHHRFDHNNLLGIADLSAQDINTILDLGDYYADYNRETPRKKLDVLHGLSVFNLFLENSTRTRLSFELAAKRLGADVINMGADGSSVKKGEALEDTLKTLNAMRPDLMVLRCGAEGAAKLAADLCACPVLNAGDGMGEHPSQALLDALTIRRRLGRLEGLTITICGDIKHSRVAKSNALLLTRMGATVRFCGPNALLPEDTDIGCFTDMPDALKDADIVMALRIQKERIESLNITDEDFFNTYGLTTEKLALTKPEALVMHPGPMNRGVEIAPEVADDPKRSLILEQVEMGVAVRMACLDLLSRNLG